MKNSNVIKKIISVVLILMMFASCMFTSVYAASPSVDAYVDYAENNIVAKFSCNVPYVTDINFYLIDADAKFTSRSDAYATATVAEAVPGEVVECKINIGSGLEDKQYKIYAVAGGHLAKENYAYSGNFRIIDQTNRILLVNDINGASQSEITSKVFALKSELQLSESTIPSWKNEYLYTVKVDDYNGNFANLKDVQAAWDVADVLKDINDASAKDVAQKIENNKSLLGVDTKNEYYTLYNEDVCDLFSKDTDNYSIASFVIRFNKAIAVAAVNNVEADGLDTVFTTYSDVLGIKDYMTRYKNLSASAFARRFDGFTAQNTKEIKDKFVSVLEFLEGSEQPGTGSGGNIIGGNGTGSGNVSVSGGSSGGSSGGGFGGSVTPVIPQSRFADVSSSHWAYGDIIALVDKGVLSGYADGTFKADASITREEFAKIVVVAFGLKDNDNAFEGYKDVKSDFWANSYIKIATVNGIINGIGNGKFGAGEKITRQDAAVMIMRAAKATGISLDGQGSQFNDGSIISDYAKEAVNTLSGAGVINGFADGTFKPNDPLTRAQTAKIVYSVIK